MLSGLERGRGAGDCGGSIEDIGIFTVWKGYRRGVLCFFLPGEEAAMMKNPLKGTAKEI